MANPAKDVTKAIATIKNERKDIENNEKAMQVVIVNSKSSKDNLDEISALAGNLINSEKKLLALFQRATTFFTMIESADLSAKHIRIPVAEKINELTRDYSEFTKGSKQLIDEMNTELGGRRNVMMGRLNELESHIKDIKNMIRGSRNFPRRMKKRLEKLDAILAHVHYNFWSRGTSSPKAKEYLKNAKNEINRASKKTAGFSVKV